MEMAFNGRISDEKAHVTPPKPGIATGRLDAVLIDPSFALVVESKLDSDFYDDQIKRYLDWLQEDACGARAPRPG